VVPPAFAVRLDRSVTDGLWYALTGEPDPPYGLAETINTLRLNPRGGNQTCGPTEGIWLQFPAASHHPAALWRSCLRSVMELLISVLVVTD
jgi:hypothetical protein